MHPEEAQQGGQERKFEQIAKSIDLQLDRMMAKLEPVTTAQPSPSLATEKEVFEPSPLVKRMNGILNRVQFLNDSINF